MCIIETMLTSRSFPSKFKGSCGRAEGLLGTWSLLLNSSYSKHTHGTVSHVKYCCRSQVGLTWVDLTLFTRENA